MYILDYIIYLHAPNSGTDNDVGSDNHGGQNTNHFLLCSMDFARILLCFSNVQLRFMIPRNKKNDVNVSFGLTTKRLEQTDKMYSKKCYMRIDQTGDDRRRVVVD